MTSTKLVRLLLATSLLAACSSSESASPDTSTAEGGAGGDAGSAPVSQPLELTGTFTLALKAAVPETMTAAFSVLGGTIYDGQVPQAFPLEVAQEEGGCQLLVPKLPFCSNGCGGDAVCVDDETCAPYPRAQDVGVVELTGLGEARLTMEPFPPSFNYQSTALPHPPCAEGDPVQLRTRGFETEAPCIAPLVLTTSSFPVQRDQALALAWQAPQTPELTRLHIKLDVSHHGGKKGEIDCDVADTGSFEVPASLVTALVELGLAGYPTIVLTRVASVSASKAPNVRFQLSSSIERSVDTGVVSCTDAAGCPADQQCNPDNLTCE